MRSVIRGVMLDAEPDEPLPKGVIAGRIMPAAAPAPRLDRATLIRAAAGVIPAIVLGAALWRGFSLIQAPASIATLPPIVAERTANIIEHEVVVTAAPIIVITPSPAPVQPARQAAQPQPQPVQRAPVVNPPAPQDLPTVGRPTARPTPKPTSGGPVRAAGVSAPISASDSGPQERLLSRACQFPDAPQGTVIKDYYTDERGVKRDAVCKPDGWKAVD